MQGAEAGAGAAADSVLHMDRGPEPEQLQKLRSWQ